MAKQFRHIWKVEFHTVVAFFLLLLLRTAKCQQWFLNWIIRNTSFLPAESNRWITNRDQILLRVEPKNLAAKQTKLVFMSPRLQSKISYSEIYCWLFVVRSVTAERGNCTSKLPNVKNNESIECSDAIYFQLTMTVSRCQHCADWLKVFGILCRGKQLFVVCTMHCNAPLFWLFTCSWSNQYLVAIQCVAIRNEKRE